MKWDNDEYKDLKLTMFEIIRQELHIDHAKKITIKDLHVAIDEMFDKLIKDKNDKDS